jgi:hypothetical protein
MGNKRGQVAIFIILALVIVAVVLLFFLLRNRSILSVQEEFTPSGFLKSCIEPELKNKLGTITRQGGYLIPEGYLTYQDEKIKYLCYTAEYYKTCTVQQPLLKEHIESELNGALQKRMGECAQGLKTELESRGYQVSLGKVDSSISINPGNIKVGFVMPLTITKDTTQNFKKLDVEVKSELYDLLLTSESIIQYESILGDSETTLYMRYYPNLKIEKVKLGDGSKIYTLSNVVTKDSFRFASRSLSWPPGYGLE